MKKEREEEAEEKEEVPAANVNPIHLSTSLRLRRIKAIFVGFFRFKLSTFKSK